MKKFRELNKYFGLSIPGFDFYTVKEIVKTAGNIERNPANYKFLNLRQSTP